MVAIALRQLRNSFILIALIGLLVVCPAMRADQPVPVELDGIGVDEHLNQSVDLSLEFTNERGYEQPLKDFFHAGRPVLLNLVYYTCPMLCSLILNGQTETLRQIPWTPGDQFEVVTISINPGETFDLAQQKKAVYLSSYGKPAPGWHFLTDYHNNTKRLAAQLGDKYRWDERGQQFAHTAVIFVLSPTGKICRYLYGIKYKARDVRLALTEASDNQAGLSVDRLLLFCFHYDPAARSYVMFATNFMRGGGIVCVLLISFFLYKMVRVEKTRRLAFSTELPAMKGH